MATNYIVSAKKATTVSHSAVGYFAGIPTLWLLSCCLSASDELNLVLAKVNRIHIYKIVKGGLKSIQEIPIFGRIVTMQMFRLRNEVCYQSWTSKLSLFQKTDSILILTDKHQLAILGWNKDTDSIRTRASGCVADRVGRLSDNGQIVTIHKNGVSSICFAVI